MQTFFGSVKKRSASTPPSRPTPEFLTPPNGVRRSRSSQQLIQTMPNSSCGGDAVRAVEIVRPQRGGQAVAGAVGDRQRFVLVVERDQRDDRAEDFLLVGRRSRTPGLRSRSARRTSRRRSVRRRRPRSPPLSTRPPSARARSMQPTTLSKCACETSAPRSVVGVVGIADAQRAHALEIAFAEALVDRALHEQARAAQADLALVGEARAHDRVEVRIAEIEIGEHDRRILAAQLERELLELRRGGGGDRARRCAVLPVNEIALTSACSTSGWPTPGPVPCTMLSTPGGKPASIESSPSRAAVQRRDLRRLGDDRVAGRERRRDLPGEQIQRQVPRRDARRRRRAAGAACS